ncbi:MAG: tRNA 2-thiouridine(34) synthase MnmA [Clostridia bacterium]|nr:tRNA 2-thiouridine(34) synthase MnmA [Clostridia bacterium]
MKVAVGLSGGVDSAVTTHLLQEQGYQPIGVYLRMHRVGQEEEAARRAAAELNIPFYIKDMTKPFEEQVMRPFAAMYKRGETPNPCILCNPAVKFRGLLEAADALGCEKIATGHYAVVDEITGLIARLPHSPKDQSYMLYGLDSACRSRLLLPLGSMPDKAEVRRQALKKGLSAAGKKDSLDICFLEEGASHGAFIEQYTGSAPAPGRIVDPTGKVLGEHKGICHYTVGQRRGLGVASSGRLYVAALDPETDTVVLGEKEAVMADTVGLREVVLHAPLPEKGLTAKIRYRDTDTPVAVEQTQDGVVLHFETPKSAPAPGQSAVLYHQNRVLGGGIIRFALKKV